MELILAESASAILRWLHVIAGIAWIGSSFYFIHLDLSLKPRPGLPPGVKGDEWQVHGGGFYHMMKYLVAPAQMPDSLTWFKWEAYTTWLSGFALLVLVYYLGADLFLIDKSVLDLTAVQAAVIAFVSLAVAWLAYEGLCRSPLGKHEVALALVGYVFLVALTYGFTHVFSGRGAFTQIGALIGTIMVANVFVIIIPYQKKTVAAMLAGKEPDPRWGAARQAAFGAQQLSDAAGRLSDAEQSLSAVLRDALQLADRRHRAGDRPGDPAFLQFAPRRQRQPVVDLGRRGRRHGRGRLAVGGRAAHGDDRRVAAGAEIRRVSAASSCRVAPCATPPSRSGRDIAARAERRLLDTDEQIRLHAPLIDGRRRALRTPCRPATSPT